MNCETSLKFKWNMDNFKFNFLSRGQLESLSLDKFLLTLFKILPCHEVFLIGLFLPLLLECSAEINLNWF